MKKIAIIDHVGSKAGMDYYSSSLMKGLSSLGCKTFLYSNFVGIEPEKIIYKSYYEGHSKVHPIVKLYKFIRATLKASFEARKEDVDLVILHLFAANPITLLLIAIPKLFGLRIAVISHDVSSFADNDNRIVQNFIYNTLSDFIIVHNQFSYQTLLQSIHIKNPKKVTVIKHGGYLDHIGQRPNKTALRQELGLDVDGKYILFFGQIKTVKGLDVLIEAMSKVPNEVQLIIAGKPWKNDFLVYDKMIQQFALEARIVKKIRFIEDDEREKLFFAADVNVLPYRIIYQSGVLLMAMSHGLPVIASNLPANIEIISDAENGLLFENGDSDDLSEQISRFFDDSLLRKKISENALITIQSEYSWDDIGSKYIQLIDVCGDC